MDTVPVPVSGANPKRDGNNSGPTNSTGTGHDWAETQHSMNATKRTHSTCLLIWPWGKSGTLRQASDKGLLEIYIHEHAATRHERGCMIARVGHDPEEEVHAAHRRATAPLRSDVRYMRDIERRHADAARPLRAVIVSGWPKMSLRPVVHATLFRIVSREVVFGSLYNLLMVLRSLHSRGGRCR